MAYLAGLIVVGLFFFVLHNFTELTKKEKILVTAVVLALVFSAIAYNAYTNAQTRKINTVVEKFVQHKTVKCNGVDVNDTYYTLSIGTYTFIGKENTPNYSQMISASTCE